MAPTQIQLFLVFWMKLLSTQKCKTNLKSQAANIKMTIMKNLQTEKGHCLPPPPKVERIPPLVRPRVKGVNVMALPDVRLGLRD